MTLNEIGKLLGYPYPDISACFSKAGKEEGFIAENIRQKKGKSTKNKMIDYSLDEALFAMKHLWRFTEMQKQILKENFIERKEQYLYKDKKKVKYSRDARNFMSLLKMAHGPRKVCATCTYLSPRKINKPGSKDSPYCNFYNCFLNKSLPKRNIYQDRCESYEFTSADPLVFSEDGYVNVDIHGNIINKTLGIDNSRFTTGRTPAGEPIILLRD